VPAPASCVAPLPARHGASRRTVTAAALRRSRAASTSNSSTETEKESQSSRAALLRGRLVAAAAALGPGALLPAWQAGGSGGDSARRDAEAALAELLTLAPPGALPGQADAPLDGAWELVYATRGTVVTRALQPPGPLASVPRPTVSAIVQTLTPSPTAGLGVLTADNAACVDLGPLGTWRLRALGRWTPQPRAGIAGGVVEALVAFDAFGLEAVSLFGVTLDGRLPALRVPLPSPLTQRGALFRTLYLDANTRVAEGAQSGNRFVFTRAATRPQ